MRYRLTTQEFLIFRDGRPFGDAGNFGGNSLKWPFAQTLTGMVRTAIGFSRSSDFFKSRANIEKVMAVGIDKIAPALNRDDTWETLMPVPADLVMTDVQDVQDSAEEREAELNVYPISYSPLQEDTGTDIANRQWLIPFVDLREKPTQNVPFFVSWEFFRKYLRGDFQQPVVTRFSEIGITAPITDVRIHNALGQNLVTEEGKLFANAAFYMKTKVNGKPLDLSIAFDVVNQDDDDISGEAWLGGERKRVLLSPAEEPFPDCPDGYENKKYLKLILTTHGDFGGWCPDWLKPDLSADKIDWVDVPGMTASVRLRSACVIGWDGASGWDYQTREPKAMKKLIRPGSTYVIEIQKPGASSEIARYFWGRSLCSETESRNNGYGQCVVGNALVYENK